MLGKLSRDNQKYLTSGVRCDTIIKRFYNPQIYLMEAKKMVQVEVNVNPSETFDRALARFKKMCGKAGIVTEIKKRSFYEKPSEKTAPD